MDQPTSLIPDGYEDFLRDLKERIRTSQVRAAPNVNRELVLQYWQIRRDILTRQQQQGWGAKVIDPATSSICAPLPRPGRTRQLCKGCLHN